MVHSLLTAGAEVDLHYGRQGTPLLAAAQEGHVEVVGALMAHGAQPDVASEEDGSTPLFVASQVCGCLHMHACTCVQAWLLACRHGVCVHVLAGLDAVCSRARLLATCSHRSTRSGGLGEMYYGGCTRGSSSG